MLHAQCNTDVGEWIKHSVLQSNSMYNDALFHETRINVVHILVITRYRVNNASNAVSFT